MEKYFFHYRDAVSLVADEEGTDFATFEEACAEAVASAKDMALESIKHYSALIVSAGSIEMTTGGAVLLTVPLMSQVH